MEALTATRKCRVCGVVITGNSRREYCRYCKRIVLRQNAIEKKDPAKRSVGSIDSCRVCGKEYTVRSGNQRYCSPCAADVAKARSCAQAQRISEMRNKRREEKRRGFGEDKVS